MVLEGTTVPQPGAHELPPCIGAHVTPRLAGSLPTVAVNSEAVFSGNKALTGVTDTVTASTVTVVVSATELKTDVAVIVTERSLAGGVLAAVYMVGAPLNVEVGEIVPQGGVEQDTLQVTP